MSEKTGRPFDLDALADDLAEVIDVFSEDPAIVIGHSYAGLEMPRLYRRHPDKVEPDPLPEEDFDQSREA